MTYRTRFQYLLDKAKDIAHGPALGNSHSHAPLDPLPVLFFFTDPARTPHPEDIAPHLPAGCGIVYRHFGEGHALQRARLLRRIADDHGLKLLVGSDQALAAEAGAHGIHLPERNLDQAPEILARHDSMILTAACHDPATLKRPEISAVRAVFVSPVFASQSKSAIDVEALGIKGVRAFVDVSPVPVYGLGGINCDTIGHLRDSGLSGVGAVDAFKLQD